MVKSRDKVVIWVLFLLTSLGLTIYTINKVQLSHILTIDYFLFLLLAILVTLFPIRSENGSYSIGDGVFLAVFVIYGFIPFIIVSTTAVVASLVWAEVKWDKHYRYPINLLMVIIMGVAAAAAYNGVGALLDYYSVTTYGILPILVYTSVYLYVNHLLVYFMTRYFYRQEDIGIIDEQFFHSFRSNLVLLPLVYLLIYLYYEIGTFGILSAALPIVIITASANTYYQTQSRNAYLMQVSQATENITASMDSHTVFNLFIQSLFDILPAARINQYEVIGEQQVLLKAIHHTDGKIESMNREIVLKKSSILYRALESHAIGKYNRSKEWVSPFNFDASYHPESAVVLPIHILSEDRGVLLVTNSKQSVYDEFMISLVEILYRNFLATLENAIHFERLEKSNLTDYLTGLPNFRGFSKAFDEQIQENTFENLSAILLDLDFFKEVNDTHGHEAGNDVLKQVADILQTFNDESRFVARYGGEEFVVLLKDYEKEEALSVAENIRKEIAETNFKVHHSIKTEQPAELNVTASLGLATYPNDCSDVYELMTVADHLMYSGSKQKGRNRVSTKDEED